MKHNLARGCLILAALAAFMGLWPVPTPADDGPALEQQVKAAYLFKFGGYVEWPEDAFAEPGSPLIIGVLGDNKLATELERIVGKRTINGRPVVVQSLAADAGVPVVHVLFVGRSQVARLPRLAFEARPVLTVTDAEKGLDQGSIISFVNIDARVRFEVSVDAARRSGLKIGAPLLSVATRVVG